jgi:Rrf2 family protein
MITMKTKYALKALRRLAAAPRGESLLIAQIAEAEDIPKKFLEFILGDLKQAGFLKSRKGRGGGYQLAKDPKEISLAAVIRTLDGPIAPVPCLSRTAYQRCEDCKDEKSCGVRLGLKGAYDTWAEVLEATTLADVVHRVDEATRIASRAVRYSI